MLIESLKQLKVDQERNEQAVIINVSTREVSTLALASALRYSGMPVLLIDCEVPGSNDGSFEHFSKLQAGFDFDLLKAPLRQHSAALDWIFSEIPAAKIVLIDSDVEILDRGIFDLMHECIDDERVFGSGFVEGPNWMNDRDGFESHGLFEERMWIPLTMLKVKPVREALATGHSFKEKQVFNDFAASPLLSRAFASLRYRVPSLRSRQFRTFDVFKESHHGLKPWLVWYDTGAQLYHYLKYEVGFEFAGFPASLHEKYAKHFSGVTNNRLNPGQSLGTSMDEINAYVRSRLTDEYNIQ